MKLHIKSTCSSFNSTCNLARMRSNIENENIQGLWKSNSSTEIELLSVVSLRCLSLICQLDMGSVTAKELLPLPVLAIQIGHAGLCPHFVRVRADFNASHSGKSIENHNTESAHLITCCNISEETIWSKLKILCITVTM